MTNLTEQEALALPIEIFNKAKMLTYKKKGDDYKINNPHYCKFCNRLYEIGCICKEGKEYFDKMVEELRNVSEANRSEYYSQKNMHEFFQVGDRIRGYCNGFFGRNDYDNKICIMVKDKYAVFENDEGNATVLNISDSLIEQLLNNKSNWGI